jgi:hypothetical protein
MEEIMKWAIIALILATGCGSPSEPAPQCVEHRYEFINSQGETVRVITSRKWLEIEPGILTVIKTWYIVACE